MKISTIGMWILSVILTLFIWPIGLIAICATAYITAKERLELKQHSNYYTIELAREELNEVSFALKARIEDIKENRDEANSPEAKDVLSKILWTCMAAQKQTTYAGQSEEY